MPAAPQNPRKTARTHKSEPTEGKRYFVHDGQGGLIEMDGELAQNLPYTKAMQIKQQAVSRLKIRTAGVREMPEGVTDLLAEIQAQAEAPADAAEVPATQAAPALYPHAHVANGNPPPAPAPKPAPKLSPAVAAMHAAFAGEGNPVEVTEDLGPPTMHDLDAGVGEASARVPTKSPDEVQPPYADPQLEANRQKILSQVRPVAAAAQDRHVSRKSPITGVNRRIPQAPPQKPPPSHRKIPIVGLDAPDAPEDENDNLDLNDLLAGNGDLETEVRMKTDRERSDAQATWNSVTEPRRSQFAKLFKQPNAGDIVFALLKTYTELEADQFYDYVQAYKILYGIDDEVMLDISCAGLKPGDIVAYTEVGGVLEVDGILTLRSQIDNADGWKPESPFAKVVEVHGPKCLTLHLGVKPDMLATPTANGRLEAAIQPQGQIVASVMRGASLKKDKDGNVLPPELKENTWHLIQ